MSISITKRYYLWQSALLTLLVGGVGGLVYFTFFPHHYFGGYPFIPVFYFVFGTFAVSMVDMCRRHAPRHLLAIFMLVRALRMLSAMTMMLVYCVAVGEEIRAFLLTFIVNYLIYLIHDSWFFVVFEKNRKLKTKNKKNETNA